MLSSLRLEHTPECVRGFNLRWFLIHMTVAEPYSKGESEQYVASVTNSTYLYHA